MTRKYDKKPLPLYEVRIKADLVALKDIPRLCEDRGLRVSTSALLRWAKEDRLEVTRIGSKVYFTQDQINKLLTGQIKPKEEEAKKPNKKKR